ncbi:MAG: hypothetical protein LBF16_11260 [Pseudomonadales bacterium]|jgi:hypothetical protein|nr:hypothetical protein [Pseudomonadales bacterium]
MLARLLTFLVAIGFSAVLMAQTGHPAKGSWSGYLSPASGDQVRTRLLINAHNGDLSGDVNPGRNQVTFSSAQLDADKWGLTIKAPMPQGELVLTGTLSNLGSWTNRKYIGTYTLGNQKGNFEFTLN